jgi:hypothetical protein
MDATQRIDENQNDFETSSKTRFKKASNAGSNAGNKAKTKSSKSQPGKYQRYRRTRRIGPANRCPG